LHGDVFEEPGIADFNAYYHPGSDTVYLDMIKVKSNYRKGGIGSSIMDALTQFADKHGKGLTLQTANRASGLGTTSTGRLKKFYKRFGFQENSNPKDYRPELPGNMNRPPVERHSLGGFRHEEDEHGGHRITSDHGTIEYVPSGDTNQVWWVESRRRGHAGELMAEMLKAHPAEYVEWGATSGQGQAFRESWHRKNPDVKDATGGERVPFDGQFDPYEHGRGDMDDEFYLIIDEIERFNLYRSASIRNPRTGQMFEGSWHGAAYDAAVEAGHDPGVLSFWDDGFTTHDGKFHTREQATKEAQKRVPSDEGAESVDLMTKGLLTTDPGLTKNDRVNSDLRKKLSDHLEQHFYDCFGELDRYAYRSAAIYHKNTGVVFEGPMHLMAHDAAARAGHPDAHNPHMWDDGFVTDKGHFEEREGRESVNLMSKGELPLAPKGAEDRPDILPEKAAQLRAIHLKRESTDRHFYDHLDELDRHADLFRSAAIKDPKTGAIFEGTWHGDARDKAIAAGIPDEHTWEWEDGFVDHEGNYYDREQAAVHTRAVAGIPTPAESITMMTQGLLPVDQSLADNPTVAYPYRKKLDDFLHNKKVRASWFDPPSTETKARREANLGEEPDLSKVDQHFYDRLGEVDRYELFRSAAIKHRWSGDMFEGTWHEAARQAAHEAGYNNPWDGSSDWIDGFVTHDGAFLDRDAAAEFSFDPETRKPGGRESVDLMIKGHLPVDEDLVNDEDLRPSLRRDLEDHLRSTGRISEDTPLINRTPKWLDRHDLYRSAAIKHPKTGEVFEGAIHVLARDNALDAMGSKALHVPWVDGFVTNEGEFHTRRQAAGRTKNKAESVALHVSGHLNNDELNNLIEQDPQILEDHGFGPSDED